MSDLIERLKDLAVSLRADERLQANTVLEAIDALSQGADPKWASLDESEYREVLDSMPDGVEGYLKGWGWLTFARAVGERLRLKNAPEAPLRSDVGAAITEAKNALHQHACHADALADRLAALLKDFPEVA